MISARATGRGRPLRFLLVILLCWAGGRLAVSQGWRSVLPQAEAVEDRSTPEMRYAAKSPPFRPAIIYPVNFSEPGLSRPARHFPAAAVSHKGQEIGAVPSAPYALRTGTTAGESDEPQNGRPSSFPSAPLIPERTSNGRWSLSSWLFWRDAGQGSSLATVGQLGGSQAGARLAFHLLPDTPERLALYGRLTSAGRRPYAPEAAVGVSFQPAAKIPVRLAVERRIALDRNARNAMAVMAVGGIGPVPLTGRFTLEGYGQTGLVGFRRRDAFADGKLSVQHPLPLPQAITAGVSISGGAQPEVARLDLGPQVQARLNAGGQSFRLSAEWRQRIAGNARPGSGPAITLAADF